MKSKNKNLIGGVLAVMILLIVGAACSQHGTKLEFNNAELYYTDNVTETEAQRLGEYLVKAGLFGGKEISVQLDKSGSVNQFRLVIKPELMNDDEYIEKVRTFGREMQTEFFGGEPLEIHMCDDGLKTVRVLKI